MKEIDINELKTIQMDILGAVHRFCVSHNIRYSLACGTMLGCARHKGYIPWDDDIDIYLLREDYNRLIDIFPDTLEGHYKFACLERTSDYCIPFGKVYDDRTVFQESHAYTSYIGVNIDVFPVDAVPDNDDAWLRYDKKRRFWQNLFGLKIGGDIKVLRFHSDRSLLKNIGMSFRKLIVKILFSLISLRTFAKLLQRIAMKYDKKQSKRVFECCQGAFQKHPFPRSLFDDLRPMPFEGREFMAFADYDAYLTNGFGNWRELPPEEKRISHHTFKAWWKDKQ